MDQRVIEFEERAAMTVPDSMPRTIFLYTIKIVLGIIAIGLLFLGISGLEDLGWMFFNLLKVAVVYIACRLLFPSKTVGVRMPAKWTFADGKLTAYYSHYPASGKRNTPYTREVIYEIEYSKITKVTYNKTIDALDIYGTYHIVIWTRNTDGSKKIHFDKVRTGAVLRSILVPQYIDLVVDTVCQEIGITRSNIEYYGSPRKKA